MVTLFIFCLRIRINNNGQKEVEEHYVEENHEQDEKNGCIGLASTAVAKSLVVELSEHGKEELNVNGVAIGVVIFGYNRPWGVAYIISWGVAE